MLGLGGGFFVARRVLRRDRRHDRAPRSASWRAISPAACRSRGTGDELDRLAHNLNAMLERIEALMNGLQGGLRQYRPRPQDAADAAAQPRRGGAARCASEADYRAALERTIEESDGLIRTFNALLMIARAESGEAARHHGRLRRRRGRRGVGELYEPLAEETGMSLRSKAAAARRCTAIAS